jgi:flagellar biosynthesis protein FliQ
MQGTSVFIANMTDGDVAAVGGKAIWVTLQVGGPILIVALLVGLVVAIFQAVTQIQEQTLTFVPKIIAVFVVVLITGGWVIGEIQLFTQETYDTVDHLVRN